MEEFTADFIPSGAGSAEKAPFPVPTSDLDKRVSLRLDVLLYFALFCYNHLGESHKGYLQNRHMVVIHWMMGHQSDCLISPTAGRFNCHPSIHTADLVLLVRVHSKVATANEHGIH